MQGQARALLLFAVWEARVVVGCAHRRHPHLAHVELVEHDALTVEALHVIEMLVTHDEQIDALPGHGGEILRHRREDVVQPAVAAHAAWRVPEVDQDVLVGGAVLERHQDAIAEADVVGTHANRVVSHRMTGPSPPKRPRREGERVQRACVRC